MRHWTGYRTSPSPPPHSSVVVIKASETPNQRTMTTEKLSRLSRSLASSRLLSGFSTRTHTSSPESENRRTCSWAFCSLSLSLSFFVRFVVSSFFMLSLSPMLVCGVYVFLVAFGGSHRQTHTHTRAIYALPVCTHFILVSFLWTRYDVVCSCTCSGKVGLSVYDRSFYPL